MPRKANSLRFIDLFAGLGGFHVGLSRVSSVQTRCVFASELDDQLRDLYKANFGQACHGDITTIDETEIPKHDVLCAGFPCQPFSKAGAQSGLLCERNGNLFSDHVLRIARHHRPRFLFLENVPNLLNHDNGRTWDIMQDLLRDANYTVRWNLLSPHEHGIPQVRRRMCIIAARNPKDLADFHWPEPTDAEPTIESVLDDSEHPEGCKLPKEYATAIRVWNKFVKGYPKRWKMPSFPIWAMEFGANYPAETGWFPASFDDPGGVLQPYQGPFGKRLSQVKKSKRFETLPRYAQAQDFPRWKVRYINDNRKLYEELKEKKGSWIDDWKDELQEKVPTPSLQKLEWNYQNGARSMYEHVLQVRASGIRVKQKTSAPALIAMTSTQVPIIGWKKRFMTVRECAALQNLQSLKRLPDPEVRAYKALGNAVNAEIIRMIAEALLSPKRASSSAAKTRRGPRRSTHFQTV